MVVLKAGSSGLHNLQQAGRIQSGDLLQIKVIKSLGKSSWQISVRGKLLAVTSTVQLTPGTLFSAKAQFSSGQLILKMIGQQALDKAVDAAELPQDELSRIIAQSFIKSAVPVSPEKAAFLYRFFKQFDTKDKSLVRLMTLLLDKGIPMDNDRMEELIHAVQGRQGSGEQDRRNDKRRQAKKSVQEALKGICEADEQDEGNLLQLFNHLRGDHGNWVVFPFTFGTDKGDLTGCIRCKIRQPASALKAAPPLLKTFSHIVMEISENDGPLYFSLSEGDEGAITLSIISNNHKISDFPADLVNRFRENLEAMSVSLKREIVDAGDFDGFDFGGTYTPVDAVI